VHLYKTSRPHMAEVGRVPGTQHFRNIRRHQVETDPHVLTLRVDESLYFANARYLEDTSMTAWCRQAAIRHVVLMCSAVNEIDLSALESSRRSTPAQGRASAAPERGEGAGDGPAQAQPLPRRLRAFSQYYNTLMLGPSGLSKLEREMVAVVVSSANRCFYCLVAHGQAVRRLSGDPHLGEMLVMNYRVAQLSERHRAMLDFAWKLTTAPSEVVEEDRGALRAAGLSQDEIFDLADVVGFFNMSNRFAIASDMMPERGVSRDGPLRPYGWPSARAAANVIGPTCPSSPPRYRPRSCKMRWKATAVSGSHGGTTPLTVPRIASGSIWPVSSARTYSCAARSGSRAVPMPCSIRKARSACAGTSPRSAR
jgi:uncharacterized peroxidase-related enzyme